MQATRLRVENWKNFREFDVELDDRVFLIGPNASGKSNFLDVFRFLRDISISGGGLQQAADTYRGGVSAIRCLSARQRSDITIDCTIQGDSVEDVWEYLLTFNQDNNRRPIIKQERVIHNGQVILDRPDASDKDDVLRLTETAIEQTSANKDFRTVVNFFRSVSYQHLLPQVVRDPQGFSPSKIENDPFGRDFLQRVENTQPVTRKARLRKILAALQVAVPNIIDIESERDDLGVPHLVGKYEHWRPRAGRQNERQFSDGTLRLFGLLWTLFEGTGPLLMEEPELSLHEEIVRHIPQLIIRVNRDRKVRRQVIMSTHSEALLSDPGIRGEEVLRLEPGDEGTRISRGNSDPKDRDLLKAGLTVADVILPKSKPKSADQLALIF